MSTELVVECPDGEDKDSKLVVGRMTQIFRKHLDKFGLRGKWGLALYKKTGSSGQDRIVFKGIISNNATGNKPVLMYSGRPMDRDSSWLVAVTPPKGIDLNYIEELESKAKGTAQTTKNEPEDETKDEIMVAVNQVKFANVVDHAQHGLNILVEGGHEGFIPLADICEGKYERKWLNRYPIDKRIKVVITEVGSDGRLKCSVRTDGILSTNSLQDVFSGVADKDGTLKLSGFTKDPGRIYELVNWLAMTAMDGTAGDPRPLCQIEATDAAMEFIITKYDAKTVSKQSVAVILTSLCSSIEPLIRKDDDGNYFLTEFGWAELGGREKFMPGYQKDNGCEDADASPVNENDDDAEVVDSDIADVIEYLGKAIRHAEVSSQASMIMKEKEELEAWLAEHSFLQGRASKLSATVKG